MTPIPLVYFITAPEKERFPIKIGRSNSASIHGRIASLQTSHPYRLEFLFIMVGGHEQETNAHRAFADQRLIGEWFRRTSELSGVIEALKAQNPDWRDLLALPHLRYGENQELV